jgi:hypothetical protein
MYSATCEAGTSVFPGPSTVMLTVNKQAGEAATDVTVNPSTKYK